MHNGIQPSRHVLGPKPIDRVERVTEETPKGRAPSMRDVARIAGVSHQTVSRVINHHPSIRESTKQRVLAVMDELQYRPNRAARALVTSRSNTIGVLAASAASLYGPASSISAIEDAARDAGYSVTVAHLGSLDHEDIVAAIDHLMAQAVEGVVVVAPQAPVLEAISSVSIGVPYVTMQTAGVLEGHELSVDQIAGARAATRHLIELGHRRIVHLAGPQDWLEARARMKGFFDELDAAGLPRTDAVLGDWTADFGYAAGRALLADHGVTAVFSSNDQMALGVLHAIRDAGLAVPGDISVVGFDDIPEAAHFWPPLTTVRQDFAELGRRCIALLLADIDGVASPVGEVVQPQLIVRASTGRLPAR